MTLEPNGALGEAVPVPCISAIASPAGLVAQAEASWKAEQSTSVANGIGASWGCVGVLFAPTVTAEWRAAWAAYFRSHACAVPPVDDAGMLRIAWPATTAESRPAEVDVILATATRAEAPRPTATEIADAWIGQCAGHERYFFENVRHGIRTSVDGDIWKTIEKQNPGWLRNETYAETIALLRAETA